MSSATEPISISESNLVISFSIRYDILMVFIFLLGMGLLNYLIAFAGKINSVLDLYTIKSSKDSDSETVSEPESPTNEKDKKTSLERLNQEILDSDNVDPFDVLNRMGKIGVKPDITTYNTLLNACVVTKNFEGARALFTEMKEPSCSVTPTNTTYNIFFKALVEAQESGPDQIEALLEEMDARDLKPNNVTLNTILDLCVGSQDHFLIKKYFDSMSTKYKLSPDDYTYSILLKHLRNCECKDECMAFLNAAFSYVEHNIGKVDDVLLGGIIETCGKQGEVRRISKLHDLLSGRRRISLAIYGKLITIYGQHKMHDRVSDIYLEIKKEGIVPTEVTFGCLLDAFLKCDKPDKAIAVYEEMNKIGPSVFNSIVYTTLIRVFAKKEDFTMAYGIYLQMKNCMEERPSLIAYNTMLDCCVKCKKYEAMGKVFGDIVKVIEPDIITYSTMIKGLCDNRKVNEALCLYRSLKLKSLKFDVILFNSLLDGVAQLPPSLSMHHADALITDMQEASLRPTMHTYSILIKLYCKANNLARAMAVLEEMKRINIMPRVIAYTTLIQLCIKTKRTEEVRRLYKDMKESGVQPDRILYNTSICGAINSGEIVLACDILCESIKEDVRLADEVYETALRATLSENSLSFQQKYQYLITIYNYVATNKVLVKRETVQEILFQISQYYWPNYYH